MMTDKPQRGLYVWRGQLAWSTEEPSKMVFQNASFLLSFPFALTPENTRTLHDMIERCRPTFYPHGEDDESE